MTSDAAAARRFYVDVVGWNIEEVPMPGMSYTLLKLGDTQIAGLMPMPQQACAAGMPPCWVGYVFADELESATAKVQVLGGKVHQGPMDIPDVGRFSVVADPQGATFDLFHSTRAGAPAASVAPGHVGWHELHASDWSRAFEFYNTMFGWQKGSTVDMGPLGAYQLFRIDGADAGGMFNSPAAIPMPFWLFYFVVDDIDNAARRVSNGGGKILHGPTQVPGGGWILQASDPQGAMFALTGPRK